MQPENQNSPQQTAPPLFKEPPRTWIGSLRFLGPGLIVIGAVIGSGELIATTLLGAKVGFLLLWLVILSCLVKVILQEQITYYVITSGGTLIDAFNLIPGAKIARLSWLSWILGLVSMLGWFSLAGIAAMGASALIWLTGWGDITLWLLAMAGTATLFFWKGTYGRIERLFVVLVALFSLCQIVALFLAQGTEFAVGWPDLWSGFGFRLPREGAYIALAVFGITGINGIEIVYYTYWCLEKGYGRYTGPPDGTPEWEERVQGWVSVMRKDLIVTAGTYTAITIAFYLLGAAILHRAQSNAADLEGLDAMLALSNIFTHSFGPWSFRIFMFGSFLVLYSTYLSSVGSQPRIGVDFLQRLGILSGKSAEGRNRWCNQASIFLAVLMVVIYFFIPSPVALILFFGGVVGAFFTPFLGFATIYLSRKLRPELLPGAPRRVLLWICSLILLGVVCVSIYLQLSD